ncbi:MAG: hypothetical protein U1F55_10410 [Chitinivorax sp.]
MTLDWLPPTASTHIHTNGFYANRFTPRNGYPLIRSAGNGLARTIAQQSIWNAAKNRAVRVRTLTAQYAPHPEYWPYPDVPPVKWPEAPNPPTLAKTGMSGKEYFQALCEREAGWFIYRTVEDVEGLYIVRPRGEEDSDYHLADPYGRRSVGDDDIGVVRGI